LIEQQRSLGTSALLEMEICPRRLMGNKKDMLSPKLEYGRVNDKGERGGGAVRNQWANKIER